MKTLYIVFALCAVHIARGNPVDPIEKLEEKVWEYAKKFSDMTVELTEYESQLDKDLVQKLGDIISEEEKNGQEMLNEVGSEIKTAVDKAEKEGKDVRHCYDEAVKMLNRYKPDFEECKDAADAYVKPAKEHVLAVQEYGLEIYKDLMLIIPECYSENFEEMEACVMKKLEEAKPWEENMRSSVEFVKKFSDSAYKRGFEKGNECVESMVIGLYARATSIAIDADKCIHEA